MKHLVAALVIVTLVACGGSDDPGASETEAFSFQATERAEVAADAVTYSEECGNAVRQAAEVGDMQDTVEDLDPAIISCESVAEFQAAADDHPTALEGTDAATWASNRCQSAEDQAVKDSDICAEVTG